MARILWKGLSATKQFTELFCLRLVFIRTTDKKLTGFDCKLFSCLLFVRQTLPRNRPRVSYQFHPYSSFQGMVLSFVFQGGDRTHPRGLLFFLAADKDSLILCEEHTIHDKTFICHVVFVAT